MCKDYYNSHIHHSLVPGSHSYNWANWSEAQWTILLKVQHGITGFEQFCLDASITSLHNCPSLISGVVLSVTTKWLFSFCAVFKKDFLLYTVLTAWSLWTSSLSPKHLFVLNHASKSYNIQSEIHWIKDDNKFKLFQN